MADNVSVIDEASFMDLLMNGLIDRVDALESKVELLEGTFDVWQKLVESILGTAQTAMQYDNYVLTFLAIGVGVFSVAVGAIVTIAIARINHLSNKKKEDAVSDAIKEIHESLEKGVLPEKSGLRSKIIDSIIDSAQFIAAVKKVTDYSNKSKEGDDNQENEKQTDKEPITSLDMKEKPVSGNER